MDPRTAPTRPTAVPIALAVGCPPDFVSRHRDAAARGGAVLKAIDLASAAAFARSWRPVVLVMTDDVHDFDPAGFEALARSAGTRLLILPSDEDPTTILEREIRAALHARCPTSPGRAESGSQLREAGACVPAKARVA